MAKVWSSVSADKSAMDNFHLPGEIRITHNGEQVFIGDPLANNEEEEGIEQEDSEKIQTLSENEKPHVLK